jgi:hypothetical protein
MKLESAIPVVPNPKGLKSSESGDVCIANIDTAGRRRRLRFGIVQLVFAIAVLVVLMAIGVDRLWRLPLLLLFWAAAIGFFQWHDKTCVALARINARQFADGVEKIEDQAELAQVQRQARKVMIKAFLVAVPLTLIALALPQHF